VAEDVAGNPFGEFDFGDDFGFEPNVICYVLGGDAFGPRARFGAGAIGERGNGVWVSPGNRRRLVELSNAILSNSPGMRVGHAFLSVPRAPWRYWLPQRHSQPSTSGTACRGGGVLARMALYFLRIGSVLAASEVGYVKSAARCSGFGLHLQAAGASC
jgi:hypothetical protein